LLSGDGFYRVENVDYLNQFRMASPRTPLGELTALPKLVERGVAALSPRTQPRLGHSGLAASDYIYNYNSYLYCAPYKLTEGA